jgi:hypothetical protein
MRKRKLILFENNRFECGIPEAFGKELSHHWRACCIGKKEKYFTNTRHKLIGHALFFSGAEHPMYVTKDIRMIRWKRGVLYRVLRKLISGSSEEPEMDWY